MHALNQALQDKIQAMLTLEPGSVMLWDLVEVVRAFIEDKHLPLPVKGDVPDLMEQKAVRDAQIKEVGLCGSQSQALPVLTKHGR